MKATDLTPRPVGTQGDASARALVAVSRAVSAHRAASRAPTVRGGRDGASAEFRQDGLSDDFHHIGHNPHGRGSSMSTWVDVGERCGNKRRVVKRLNTAWNRSVGNACTPVEPVAYAESGVVSEPRRRSRTPLTEQEVDAMRTARANGVSVSTIARQFRVHRGTVWEKTHY